MISPIISSFKSASMTVSVNEEIPKYPALFLSDD